MSFSVSAQTILLASCFLVHCQEPESCVETVTITARNLAVFVSPGTVCFQCNFGDGVDTNSTFQIGSASVDSSQGISVMGVLVIHSAEKVFDIKSLSLRCTNGRDSYTAHIFLKIFQPPNITGNTTAMEGNTLSLDCDASNSRPLPTVAWFNHEGVTITKSRDLVIANISKTQSGMYKCVATDTDGNSTNSTVDVIVQYAPVVSTVAIDTKSFPLAGTVTLYCNYQGVPSPNQITWKHNNTILSDFDSDISIVSNSTSTMLTRYNLPIDGGGMYTCSVTNVAGTGSIDVFVRLQSTDVTGIGLDNVFAGVQRNFATDDVPAETIIGAACGAFGLYAGVVFVSASYIYWSLPLVAGLSGSLVVLMAVGVIITIAVLPIGIILLSGTCCFCRGSKSSQECYDSSYHNVAIATSLLCTGVVISIIIFPLSITALILHCLKYKERAQRMMISIGIMGSVTIFPIGLVLLFASCCFWCGKESDDQPHKHFKDLSDCQKGLIYIGGVASVLIFPLGIVILIYHYCSEKQPKGKYEHEMKTLRSGSFPDPEITLLKEPTFTDPMYQDPSTIQHQPHPETGEIYAVVQQSRKKKEGMTQNEQSGSMYQDPKTIGHQQAESGDLYALPQKYPKKRKKGMAGEEPKTEEELAQMYSPVSENRKQKREELVYADLNVHTISKEVPQSPHVSEYTELQHSQ